MLKFNVFLFFFSFICAKTCTNQKGVVYLNCQRIYTTTKQQQNNNKMTTLEAVQLAGQIQKGTILKGRYQIMVVDRVENKRVYGYDKNNFEKRGKKSVISMSWETLLNPHYNKEIKIINN
jgi:hypothetical protein